MARIKFVNKGFGLDPLWSDCRGDPEGVHDFDEVDEDREGVRAFECSRCDLRIERRSDRPYVDPEGNTPIVDLDGGDT